MKKQLCFLLLASLPLTTSLQADLDDDTTIEGNYALAGYLGENHPFHIKADGDATGNADFKRKSRGHVSFAEVGVDGTAIFYANPCYDEAAFGIGGYEYTRIHWNKNPYFDQSHFHTLALGLGAVTKRLGDWLWQAQLRANFDLIHFKFSEYITWDMFAWGRYSYCPDINLHFGFLAFTGMKFDRVYPIVGFDWKFKEKWKLNAIFPIDMSLQYFINNRWSLALAAKFIQSRHRVGPHENLPRGIVVYTAGGIEFGVDYISVSERFTANVHIGEILGGILKVANMHYHHKRRFRFRTAPYAGGEVTWKF